MQETEINFVNYLDYIHVPVDTKVGTLETLLYVDKI